MTQNVKKSRASLLRGRSLAALLLLGSSTLAGAIGCSKSDTHDDPTADAGASGCMGSDCNVPLGRFTACEASSECDEAHGFSCVNGECSYECQSHADCVEVGHCEAISVEGEHKNFCVRDATRPEPGKLYTSCPNGDECTDPTLCIGAGPGDLDAYCTIDCSSDDDCAVGYLCGTLVNDDKTERRVCRQREFCAPCSSDADCLGVPNQIGAKDESGEKICTRLCDTDTHSCPWGNASGCGYFDDELGAATCSHRFGSCHGSGKTCEPCRNDDDCPGGACISSSFTGEHWCVDLSISCECPNGVDASGVCNNGGCPDSPSGLGIQCIGEQKVCYAANTGSQTQLGASPQTGCWGAE